MFPRGAAESRSGLRDSMDEHLSADFLELNWWKIIQADQKTKVRPYHPYPEMNSLLRLTMDYPEDYSFFKTVIETLPEEFYSIDDHQLIKWIVENSHYEINAHLEKPYRVNTQKQLLKQRAS